jgi:hypothetical protein
MLRVTQEILLAEMEIAMNFDTSFTSIAIALLDIALIWSCLAIDAHLKFLDANEENGNDEHAQRISEYMY